MVLYINLLFSSIFIEDSEMPQIGDIVVVNGKKYSVLEVSKLDGLLQLGILNNKGLIIESFWFDAERLKILA